jgi:uncharacterized protein (TIGR00296 family)
MKSYNRLLESTKGLILKYFKNGQFSDPPTENDESDVANGVFLSAVKINGAAQTLFYVGYPFPQKTLKKSLYDLSVNMALQLYDMREKLENAKLSLVLDLLSTFVLVEVDKVLNLLDKIELGVDGIFVEKGFRKALILPNLPLERGWSKEELLSEACLELGLFADQWLTDSLKVYKFKTKSFKGPSFCLKNDFKIVNNNELD